MYFGNLRKSVRIFNYYIVCICKYINVFLLVFCQYMHVLHVYARIDATNTFACLKYLQIRAIRANTNQDTCIYVHQIRTKYVQIHQIVFVCICQYMHVYDSICMYFLTAGCWSEFTTMCMVSICMYMHVFACIWTVYDSRQ